MLDIKTAPRWENTGKKMSDKLFEKRANLTMAYQDATDKLAEAREAAGKAKLKILMFDDNYPEVMQTVNKEMGERKKAARAAERKIADENAEDSGVVHTAEGDASLASVSGEGG